jgi:hypothetical protein
MGTVTTKNLSVWREQEIKLKWQKKGSKALFVGWNYDLENNKETIVSVPDSLIANYSINLTSNAIDSSSALVFSMTASQESSAPKSEGKWVKNHDVRKSKKENNADNATDGAEEDKSDVPKILIDFTIQLRDTSGQRVSLLLSQFSPLQNLIEVMIMKTGFLLDEQESEMVFQTFYFPIEQFQKINPDFIPSNIEEIKFLFNKNESGVIAIDNIGFMKSL